MCLARTIVNLWWRIIEINAFGAMQAITYIKGRRGTA